MKYKDKILKYLKKNNGIITAQYCREEGIPTIYLTRLVEGNILTRIDRGMYISKGGDYDEYYFFQHKFKRTVFSYETALYLQELTDKIPQVMEVSIPYSYKINELPKNVKLYYVKNEITDMGAIEVKTIYQNKVRAYNIERIICDFIQNKSNIDPETYAKTIREYASSKYSDINKLFIYAHKMGITEKVRATMEVIYE
ncbi:MAG: type IV toxin-antitoxin system AbiEi family antitoxin domain-containing protein [Senegalia sp. (in: firmicutes)]|uniref:type IV toxin-antitoxin system AbiEi family antitoxin domain-containing protein n=1 Tax=Senegalia sp. (in: firmicutes) TaxID=1924098 RepID=UPI003F9860AD